VFAFWRKAWIQSLLDHPVNIGKPDLMQRVAACTL